MPTMHDAQKQAWTLFEPNIPFNPDSAIYKKWLALKAEGNLIGVPLGAELHLGNEDGKPRAAQTFNSGVVLTWYGGADVRLS